MSLKGFVKVVLEICFINMIIMHMNRDSQNGCFLLFFAITGSVEKYVFINMLTRKEMKLEIEVQGNDA